MKLNIAPTPEKLLFFLIALVLQSFLSKIPMFYEIDALGFIDELVVVLMIAIIGASSFTIILKQRKLLLLLVVFLIYSSLGLISSVFGDVFFWQALYQYVLDLKFFVVVFFCFLAYQEKRSEQLFDYFMKYSILINTVFVFVQLSMPSVYDTIFASGAHFGMVFTQGGDEFARTAGFFWFTGTFAFFSSLAVGYFFLKIRFEGSSKVNFYFLFSSLFLLISTLSRGEIGACMISLLIVSFLASKTYLTKSSVLVSLAILSFGMWMNFSDVVGQSLDELGFSGLGYENAPRALFMNAGIDLANRYFPFGAGLGSLGGQSAVVYDSHFYYEYLISHEWFFSYGMYLTDTFWPKVLAETGYTGVIVFLLFFSLIMPGNVRLKFESSYTTFALFVMLINSFSAPSFNSPLSVIMCLYILSGIQTNVKVKT